MTHRTLAEMEAGLDDVRRSPADEGTVELIVRRPATEARELLDEAELDSVEGVVGDNWAARGSRRTPDRKSDPEMQVTLMNARAASLVAGDDSLRPLAGDQLYVDLDLSVDNLPPGTRLTLGTAVVEITAKPHRGCAKFAARFGEDAVRFVNSPEGKQLNLRGVNAKVVVPGTVRRGDVIRKQ